MASTTHPLIASRKNSTSSASLSSTTSSYSYASSVPSTLSVGLGKYAPQVNLVQVTSEPPTAAFKRDFGEKSFSLYNSEEIKGIRVVDPTIEKKPIKKTGNISFSVGNTSDNSNNHNNPWCFCCQS